MRMDQRLHLRGKMTQWATAYSCAIHAVATVAKRQPLTVTKSTLNGSCATCQQRMEGLWSSPVATKQGLRSQHRRRHRSTFHWLSTSQAKQVRVGDYTINQKTLPSQCSAFQLHS
eukprot:COSAG06_NODE_2578_length_6622_cov_18.934386_2_plen_115_part_00